MKKKSSVNLPVELTDKVKALAQQHGLGEYDHCSFNQMVAILLGLGIEVYETIKSRG